MESTEKQHIAEVTASELLVTAQKTAESLLLHAENEVEQMRLLTQIDERSKNTVDLLGKLNSKVATHENSINELKLKEARREGGIEVFSKMSGAVWGVGSSVIVYAIVFFFGLKK